MSEAVQSLLKKSEPSSLTNFFLLSLLSFGLSSCLQDDQSDASIQISTYEELVSLEIDQLLDFESEIRNSQDSFLLAEFLVVKAGKERQIGEFQKALLTWEQLFTIERFIAEHRLGSIYVELGNLHHYLDSPVEAIAYYRKAIPVNKSRSDARGVVIALHNISSVYNNIKQYDSAEYYQRSCISYAFENELDSLGHEYQSELGLSYLESGALDSAEKYLSAEIENAPNDEDQSIALLNYGYYQERVGRLDTAYQLYILAGSLAERSRAYRTHWKAINNQAYVSYFSGEYKRAFVLLDSLIYLKKDQHQLDLAERISGLEKKYQNLQQEKELQELRFETERTSLIRNTSFAIVGLALLVSGLIVNAVFNRMRQSRARSNERIAQLQREKEMNALQTMIVAQEEERKRIAMDLHDGIGVLLSAARLRLSRLSKRSDKQEETDVVTETESIIQNASQEVRRVSHQMMPGVLTKLGLFEGIEDLMESIEEQHGIKINLKYPDLDERFSEKVEVMIYRIVQELINNTLKHSGAKQVNLIFRLANRHMHVEYQDDGKGFDAADASIQKSLGIQSIATRVKLLNGIHEIISSPGNGMQVVIDFDIAADEDTLS